MTMLIPIHVHPLEDPGAWQAVAAAGPSVTAIINIDNGPGRDQDTSYLEVTDTLRTARVPMIGYVDLGHLRRSEEEVEEDLAAWRRYPVEGFFFDRTPTDPAGLLTVARLARPTGGMIVLNPGTRPHPAYASLADLVCTFEGPWTAYRDLPDEPDWPNAAHLIHGVDSWDLPEAHARMTRLAGGGLVTDLDSPLPYRGVPSWLRATAAVQR